MNSQTKNISWISYCSLVLSMLPIPFFLAFLYNLNWTTFITMPLIIAMIIIAFVVAMIGIFKKKEHVIIPTIALMITIGSGFFVTLIVIVSGMGQPT